MKFETEKPLARGGFLIVVHEEGLEPQKTLRSLAPEAE